VSIRQSLLALLAEQPRHGYELRVEFESRTGTTWPLNIGQVYTTLARLERDGRVAVSDDSDEQHKVYEITDAGRAELKQWFATPVSRDNRPRDELAIKLALAADLPDVELAEVVQAQRRETMATLQDYTRLKRGLVGEPDADLAWSMVLDSLIFAADAEVRWLDACEQRLADRRPRPVTAGQDRGAHREGRRSSAEVSR
jgi:DNA-binding PadR family transcriptional regulator